MATDQYAPGWLPNAAGEVLLLGVCDGCLIPADECPDTLAHWVIQIVTVDEANVLPGQEYIRCGTEPQCPGHPVERKLYCLACQKEGKHELTSHPHS